MLHFNSSSLAKLDLLRDPISAAYESIRFRFKTSYANGIVLYSRGTQGDYIALQLKDNRMVLNIDLGSGLMTTLSVGSLLDDNVWHDVVVSRNRRDIIFSVDRVIVRGRIKGEFSRLNLNRAVSNARMHSLMLRKLISLLLSFCRYMWAVFQIFKRGWLCSKTIRDALKIYI